MESGLKACLRYLVIKSLIDKSVIRIIYEYFVENSSPSVLASRYGVTRHQVRGYVLRITDKMSHVKARAVIKHVYPYLMDLGYIFEYDGYGYFKCKLCGLEIPNIYKRTQFAMHDHISKNHMDYVDTFVDKIIESLKQNISRNRC